MKKVLFVCLGNICRSPAAHGYFDKLIQENHLQEKLMCDSAGTSAYHQGEPADGRMQEAALNRGYRLSSISRGFNPKIDFDNFDLIIAMDNKNHEHLCQVARDDNDLKKIVKMVSYCKIHNVDKVPDPYYGGARGFELVLDIVEDACDHLLKEVSP